ncbi:MAG: short-chain dehydrogenase/reductase [Nocardia sp.]|nr:short-chain dehydrogenase/reductase [Nocardia sp.]
MLLTARSDEAGKTAAAEVGAIPLLDVTDNAGVVAAAEEAERPHGRLDVLINNAAITYDTSQRAPTSDLAVVHEAAETNLYGP